jgi:hypothetical protein
MFSGRSEIFSLSSVSFHLVIAEDVFCHFSYGMSSVLGLWSPVCTSRPYKSATEALKSPASAETRNFNAISTLQNRYLFFACLLRYLRLVVEG